MNQLDLNTKLTIFMPLFVTGVIACVGWAINAKLDNQQLRMEAAISQTYVSKEDFKNALKESTEQTNEHFKRVEVDFQAVRGDLARLSGGRGLYSPRQQETQP